MSTKLITNPDEVMDELRKAYLQKDTEAAGNITGMLQAFCLEPITEKKKKYKIQSVGVSTDFAIMTKDSFNVTVEEQNFDLGWEQAFRQVSLGKEQDSWEIATVTNGLAFRKVEEGQRVQMDKLSGTKISAYVDYYGGALGWTDKMIRFRKIPKMVDMAMIFRNRFWENKANNHYSLLATAAALTNIAYQGVAAAGQLRRDILTLNLAQYTLGNTNKDKGYGNTANSPFLLYADPFDEDRIEAAYRVTTEALATVAMGAGAGRGIGQRISNRRVKRVYTYNANIVPGNPIMVLPGQKSQKADAMLPTTFTAPVDPLTLNRYEAVWAIYGAVLGDTEQCLEISLD